MHELTHTAPAGGAERLKAKGAGVSEKELEKRLAALRAVLEEMQGGAGESGSAALRKKYFSMGILQENLKLGYIP